MNRVHTTLSKLCSGSSVQHALAERLEGGSSISLLFEQLEAGDLSFRLSIAPRQDQTRLNGLDILQDSLRKRMKVLERALGYLFQSGIELTSGAGAHHARTLLDELRGQSDFFMHLTELFDASPSLLPKHRMRRAMA